MTTFDEIRRMADYWRRFSDLSRPVRECILVQYGQRSPGEVGRLSDVEFKRVFFRALYNGVIRPRLEEAVDLALKAKGGG